MKRSVLVLVSLLLVITAKATTYYSVANAQWNGSGTWSSVCSTCTGGYLPALVDGDIIIIDDQVTILSGLVTVTAVITIVVRTDFSPNTITNPAKLKFTSGGKIALPAGSVIRLENWTGDSANDPQIDGTGSGASNQIDIGGVEYWRASEGDVIGVGTLQPNGTLPITLLSFTAKSLKNSILLTWVTSMEKDFAYFQLERANSSLEFVPLVTLDAKGGLDFETTYTHTDLFPMQGKNYYRLKSVDLDRTFKYSDLIVSEWTGKQQLSVYPNPITDRKVTFELNDLITKPIAVSVVESLGYVVYQTQIESNLSTINLPDNLAAGHYLIRVQLSSGVRTIPVVLN
jgi:hypothetical protein